MCLKFNHYSLDIFTFLPGLSVNILKSSLSGMHKYQCKLVPKVNSQTSPQRSILPSGLVFLIFSFILLLGAHSRIFE